VHFVGIYFVTILLWSDIFSDSLCRMHLSVSVTIYVPYYHYIYHNKYHFSPKILLFFKNILYCNLYKNFPGSRILNSAKHNIEVANFISIYLFYFRSVYLGHWINMILHKCDDMIYKQNLIKIFDLFQNVAAVTNKLNTSALINPFLLPILRSVYRIDTETLEHIALASIFRLYSEWRELEGNSKRKFWCLAAHASQYNLSNWPT